MAVEWDYYDKFETINDKYLPEQGEGETLATQICTAVNKLVYKWYNDGDVYDNTKYLSGWCNDISCFANWLDRYMAFKVGDMLERVYEAMTDSDYEDLLKDITDTLLDENFLATMEIPKQGTLYGCKGRFKFVEPSDDDDDDDYYEDENEYEDEE